MIPLMSGTGHGMSSIRCAAFVPFLDREPDGRARFPSPALAGEKESGSGPRYSRAPSGAALSACRRLLSSEAATSPVATTAIMIVHTALISGFTPRRTSE